MKHLYLALIALSLLSANAAKGQFINEFLASNVATLADSAGEFDDWVEIYNAGSTPLNLGGYFLTDDPLNPAKYLIPSGPATVIPAQGFLLFWCDEDGLTQGPLHTNFKLSVGGEFIGLYAPDTTVVDTLLFGAQTADVSYGRTPNGGPTWVTFAAPTPEASNVPAVGIDPSIKVDLFVYPSPTTSTVSISDHRAFDIFNVAGEQVGSSNESGVADVASFVAGFYIVRSSAGAVLRFIKR